ncbi:MAG TPA: hypothetical protein VK539_34265 [Myxococcaceae bacterium]|nr:hypothetical protein [Myxococcaceae bacterium]
MTTHGTVCGALLVVTMISGGCTAARMAVPEELNARAAALPVERDTGPQGHGTLRFGPHQVTEYRQGWTTAPGVTMNAVSVQAEQTPYRFRITPAGEGTRAVECKATRARLQVTQQTTLAGRPATSGLEADVQPRRVSCTIASAGPESRSGQLRIEQEPGRSFAAPHGRVAGRAQLGEVALEIESSTRLEGGAQLAYAGFQLRQGERLIAAVETLNQGRVWLAPELTPEVRELAVVASSALLLDSGWQTPVD